MVDISVIVTIYNIKSYIGECLDSILKQTEASFEVICVDDASTDGSESILKEYEKKDRRIKVIRLSENKGLASARNEGYRQATGKYLYNIDGDDLLADGALSKMYGYMQGYDLDLLAFSAKAFYDDEISRKFGTESEYIRKYEYPGVYDGPTLFAMLLKNGDRATTNRVLYCYRKDFIKENNLFDEEGLRYADDSMFAFYMAAKRVKCISAQLYLRRYRQGSAVTSPLKKRYMESMIVLYMAELCRWRSLDLREEVNHEIKEYFDSRLKEIGWLNWKFQTEDTEMLYLKEHPADQYFYECFLKENMWNIKWMTDEQLNKIKSAEHVILYGAGYIATEVAKELEKEGIVEYLVAVSNTAGDEEYLKGKKIYGIDELEDIEKRLVIVAMSKKYRKEIENVLEGKNVRNVIWVSM